MLDWLNVASFVISVVSLSVSISLGRALAPYINKSCFRITLSGDAFYLMFAEKGDPKGEQKIPLVNYNNRDILVYLQSGYVCNDGKRYNLKPAYYKLLANDITEFPVEVDMGHIDNEQKNDSLYLLKFQYQGMFLKRTIKFRMKRRR